MNYEPTYGLLAVNHMDTCKYVTIVVSQIIFLMLRTTGFSQSSIPCEKPLKKEPTNARRNHEMGRKTANYDYEIY